MPIASPQFIGVWSQKGESESIDEEAVTKYNRKTGSYLVRILSNKKYSYTYEKRSDSDTIDVNGDKLAIENLNDPVGGKPWEMRLESLDVVYDMATGLAICTKILIKEQQIKTKEKDLPINTGATRIV